MNKLTPIVLVTLVGLTTTAFADTPAKATGSSMAQGAPAMTIPHDAKANTGKAVHKKHHVHRKHAAASTASSTAPSK